MAAIERLQTAIETGLKILLVLSVVGLAGTMTLQVGLRYLVNSSFLGVEEISALFGLWLYYVGLALVSLHDAHVRGGFLAGLLPPRGRAALNRIFAFACAALCAYFCLLSIRYLGFILGSNRRSTFLRWPSWIWAASLCLGLGLSALLYLLRGFGRPALRHD